MNRYLLAGLLATLGLCGSVRAESPAQPRKPNVVIVITDDQGYGDLGFHGNPVIQTPNLDRLARASVQLQAFYVSPVCAPTRASLMTGRYNYRTGVVDTFLGRAMMHSEEVTLAEMLAAAGYRTGIFGKWHLGDNYPLRALDQGFQEVLVHNGGGIGQPADPPGNTYFNPLLQHNGRPLQTSGYCSDVFTDAALRFIADSKDRPFFVYLAYNCPHTPLQVHDRYRLPYTKVDLSNRAFPALGYPLPAEADRDTTARVYGMITNIDDNLGRLFARLDELNLTQDTLVIFLTDNGPQQVRYTGGLRGRKGGVHDGGVRVPCFLRWPAQLRAGHTVDHIAAHIDLAPTVLEVCGVARPPGVAFDGVSLLPLLRGQAAEWPERTLFMQWHRGDEPELYRAFAARSQRYKLVQPLGANARATGPAPLLLFDMTKDPYEKEDLAARHPEVVARMRQDYEAWFKDVSGTRGYAPPRIHLGASQENPTTLTRQDWRGPHAGWGPKDRGHWEVQVSREGTYDITLRLAPLPRASKARFSLREVTRSQEVRASAAEYTFTGVRLTPGPGRLEASIEHGSEVVGVTYVDVRRVE